MVAVVLVIVVPLVVLVVMDVMAVVVVMVVALAVVMVVVMVLVGVDHGGWMGICFVYCSSCRRNHSSTPPPFLLPCATPVYHLS